MTTHFNAQGKEPLEIPLKGKWESFTHHLHAATSGVERNR